MFENGLKEGAKMMFFSLKKARAKLALATLLTFFPLAGLLNAAEASEKKFTGLYVTVPDILVNLSGGTKNHFLKMALTIEVKNAEDAKVVNDAMPHLVDQFLVYLVELRVEDLQGAEGLLLLKRQLQERANAILEPVKVSAMLFRSILVQ